MEELDIAVVVNRSIHGVIALVTRTLFIQVISFVVNILLTIFLSPSVFGIYFVVSAVIAFLQYFSDIGLAAALIQKKEPLTKDDLKTTFTMQQILVVSIILIALFSSHWVGKFYSLEQPGLQLFQALVIAFFLSSLKTIPSIILERELHFDKLVIPQIVETLFFNVTALIFAIKGFGITSFTYAVLARGITGLVAMYIVAPWKIEIGLSKQVARRLLSFGIPFQANSLLALIKDDLLIAYVGKVLPLAQVGYIGFAQKWALTPLRLVMDNIIRITFPSFSRLQHKKQHLRAALEKSLFVLSFLIFPSLFGLVILFPYLIHLIPKYQKWEPALLSLGFFAINAGLSSISTPLVNALNAIGNIKISLNLMVFWTITTWILTPLAIMWFGFNGFAVASAIISLSVVGVVYIVKKYIDFSILPCISYTFFASCGMGIFLYFIAKFIASTFLGFVVSIVIGGFIYFGIMWILARKQLLEDIAVIKRQFAK